MSIRANDNQFPIRLRIDPASVQHLNDLLTTVCREVASGSEALQHAFTRFLGLTDFPHKFIEMEPGYGPSGEFQITLKPSRDFRHVISAVLIGNADYLITETNRHVNAGQLQGQL